MIEYTFLAAHKSFELFAEHGFHFIYNTITKEIVMMAKEAYVLPIWNQLLKS